MKYMTYYETVDNKEEKKRRYQEYYEKGLRDVRESKKNDEDKRGAHLVSVKFTS